MALNRLGSRSSSNPAWSMWRPGRRGVSVPDAARARVEGCTDPDQLEVWAQRAVHACDAQDLFVDAADDPA